jgi:plastocyanin
MNTLDSRALNVGDCFVLTFPVVGTGRYLLSSGAFARSHVNADEGFAIEVKAKSSAAAPAGKHTVLVTRDGRDLLPDAKSLSVIVGDTVLWYTSDPKAGGFAVGGAISAAAFSSHALKAEAAYTHAFGSPGTYEWGDPNGGAACGTVVVEAVTPRTDAERQAWLDSLSRPTTFEIRGGKATPDKVKIVVGQTVVWKVWDGDGLAIVDKRLIPPKPHQGAAGR